MSRRKFRQDMNFAEYDEYGRKKPGLLKKAAMVGGAAIGAAAATKYGAKRYAKHQATRARAARGVGLNQQAKKIEGGRRTKWAQKIGGIGDKQINKAKSWGGKQIEKGRKKFAKDKNKYEEDRLLRKSRAVGKASARQKKSQAYTAELGSRMKQKAQDKGKWEYAQN